MPNCQKARGARKSAAARSTFFDAVSGMGLPANSFGGSRRAAAMSKALVAAAAILALGACAAPMARAPDQPPGFIEELPQQVVALAAPYQDLRAVRLRPEDGCYWYQRVGPVETTMLPLRTAAGGPICTQREGVPGVAG